MAMEQGPPGPSLLTYLALVQRRPGMYLGMDDQRPDRRLDALRHLINGYCGAIHAHRPRDPGFDEWTAFPERLVARFGWSMSQGPIQAIRDASSSDEEAWTKFWALLRELTAFEPIGG
jgi:hypothetical protein